MTNWYWVHAPAGKVKLGICEAGKSPAQILHSLQYLAKHGPIRRIQAESVTAGDMLA
jgi:hypothetical protein